MRLPQANTGGRLIDVAVPEHRIEVLHDLVRVIARIDLTGARVQQREVGKSASRAEAVRRLVDQDPVLVSARQLVADEPVRALDERRRVQRVVDRRRIVGDVGIRIQDVREALNEAWRRELSRPLTGVLARKPQLRVHLVVEPYRGLLDQIVRRRDRAARDFVVVVGSLGSA